MQVIIDKGIVYAPMIDEFGEIVTCLSRVDPDPVYQDGVDYRERLEQELKLLAFELESTKAELELAKAEIRARRNLQEKDQRNLQEKDLINLQEDDPTVHDIFPLGYVRCGADYPNLRAAQGQIEKVTCSHCLQSLVKYYVDESKFLNKNNSFLNQKNSELHERIMELEDENRVLRVDLQKSRARDVHIDFNGDALCGEEYFGIAMAPAKGELFEKVTCEACLKIELGNKKRGFQKIIADMSDTVSKLKLDNEILRQAYIKD